MHKAYGMFVKDLFNHSYMIVVWNGWSHGKVELIINQEQIDQINHLWLYKSLYLTQSYF